jgi:excisionase family DNA binding protein
MEHEDIFQRPRVNLMQACAIAGVSRRTIYYWLQLGKVEAVRTAGGALRIYADTLLRREAMRESDRTAHSCGGQ